MQNRRNSLRYRFFKLLALVIATALFVMLIWQPVTAEQRNSVSYLRGRYNDEFFERHNRAFRTAASLHFSHSKQHDVLLLTPFARHEEVDAKFNQESVDFANNPPRTEPTQEYYAPYTSRAMWKVLRAIDWTHMLHEQTYDIMSDRDIAWKDKGPWLDRSVRYYLDKELSGVPRSPAPLDVTMRRAAVMMKPYFTLFRNYYPQSNNFFYAAHWWHPVPYEAMMLGGNGAGQNTMVNQVDDIFYAQVLKDRPQRMVLSRELMPRYARLSPESANIFDNLHMLHGITYDILSYESWNLEQKKAEVYRVIKAMSYQPGDEKLVRKFSEPRPEQDPRDYSDWVKSSDGEMSRIMMEMMDEMMPMMMPDGMTSEMEEKMMAQFKMKMKPGLQEGELLGSLHDAMMAMMPDMKMMPEAMEPGQTPTMMVDMMLKGWQEKYGNLPDIEPISMDSDPTPPPLTQSSTN